MTTIHERVPLRLTREEVLARLTDRAFVAWRGEANSALRSDLVEHRVTPAEVVIRSTATIGADWLPGKVAAAATALPTITRIETWDLASGTGRTEFSGFGVPASASAIMSIEPGHGRSATPDGCVLAHQVRLQVDLPFVGGLVEKALAGRIAATLRIESELYDSYRPDQAGPGLDPR